jgi:precorrin-6B methylase 2
MIKYSEPARRDDVCNIMCTRVMLLLLLSVNSLNTLAQDPWKNVYRESAWKDRDAWQHPDVLIQLMNIPKGGAVADIGCNEGYMTVKLAAAVTNTGRVYAVDVSQSKLNLLNTNLSDRNISNVTPIKGDADDPKLPRARIDAALILDTYHEMDEHDAVLSRVYEALRPGGRLVICEPIGEDRRSLSRGAQEKRHELGINFALDDLRKAGFEIVSQKDPFVDRSNVKGDKMWVIVARKR